MQEILIKGNFPPGMRPATQPARHAWHGTLDWKKSQIVPGGRLAGRAEDGYEANAANVSGHFILGIRRVILLLPLLLILDGAGRVSPGGRCAAARARASKKCQGRSDEEGRKEGRTEWETLEGGGGGRGAEQVV